MRASFVLAGLGGCLGLVFMLLAVGGGVVLLESNRESAALRAERDMLLQQKRAVEDEVRRVQRLRSEIARLRSR